jgi:hypothetical protein
VAITPQQSSATRADPQIEGGLDALAAVTLATREGLADDGSP